ncbi:MAG TPA: prolyl oligopeptidase family serine peptidase [Candidatus Limnocylindrales bacterium]|nr:prolyl oligopeptidase family serine peptidase [Candidatus Limnocylindrales bacterium]
MAAPSRPPLRGPEPPTTDQVDDYHGTLVADPYRPLEDADAPATRAWIRSQNELTEAVLSGHPGRSALQARLAELWNHPRAGAPWRRGRWWFQLRNSGLQDQDVLWATEDLEAAGHVVFDPNELSREGTTALASIAVSESGELVAIALSHAGSDWRRWRVRRTATGEELPDRVDWSKFSSAAWTHDDAGFFYGCYPEPPADAAYDAPNLDMEIRYHRIGTEGATDQLVFATPEQPDWDFEPAVSDDGRLLILSIARGTDPERRIYVADLTSGVERAVAQPLLDAADARYELIAAVDGTIFLVTDRDAPLGRIVAIDVDDPTVIREIVPEANEALETAQVVGGRIAVAYLHDAHSRLALFELDGRHVVDVPLPGIGSIGEMSGRRTDDQLYLTFTTFAAPSTVVAVRMADGHVRAAARPPLPWDPDDYLTEQVFASSADGTRVPLFLSRRRDTAASGDVATLLHGYGGFAIPQVPIFKPEWLAWMERGGLLALASLRGGGEYGSAWHDAGRLANKQNVFDDFAACLRWLAASDWTGPERIAISGRSNGGLLVGATITQHPELYGAALAEVGVMDMLRFHRFTIGWGWTSDFGSPDDPDDFRTIRAYSPLHNIRPGVAYPPTLVTTGDHDDRVVPGHSFKFAAALQAAQAGDAPIVIRVDTDAGHGAGKPVHKLIAERADVVAFLELALAGHGGRSSANGR